MQYFVCVCACLNSHHTKFNTLDYQSSQLSCRFNVNDSIIIIIMIIIVTQTLQLTQKLMEMNSKSKH